MGSLSMWHWAIVMALVFLLFGGGKISALMEDVAKGIKSFKRGLNEDEATAPVTRAAAIPKIDATRVASHE
jgi:sec-independent protein translocase protein TatA